MIEAPGTQSVELSSGVALPYFEQGDPEGIPLVLLHGLPLTGRSFEPILPHLPPTLHVVVPTLRGHGDASRPQTGYGFRDFAADVAGLLDQLDIGAATIAGHSLGSLVAQRFAVDHPQRTRGLVLVSSALTGQEEPEEWSADDRELWDAISQLTDPVDPTFVRTYVEGFSHPRELESVPGSPGAFVDSIVEEGSRIPAAAWREVWKGMVEDDFSAELAERETPTLVIWGDQDPFCLREDQDALLATLPDARLAVYDGAGHNLFWAEPERFAADLGAFVERAANERNDQRTGGSR
jgi:non-heme chloroperoxidase